MEQNSSSAGTQYMLSFERALFGFIASLPCLMFFWVNVLILYTLRSRAVFREASRHVLLFHLLLADTVQMILMQALFVLSLLRLLLAIPLCAFLLLSAHATHDFSPLMLRVGVSRCVGVTVSTVLVRLGLMLPSSNMPALNAQMTDLCNSLLLYPTPHSQVFGEALVYTLFVVAFLSIAGSYAAVMRTANSLSTDQASARKARATLLLHLFQLSLMVTSTFTDVLQVALYYVLPRLMFIRVQITIYIFLIILPKCLSVLVYGLRDPAIRTALILNLCCRRKGLA
ncbi:hypothetical protein WMY93_007914 [Mugilogobius chulae]|uniref:G-protein coupled receptors family 1 profile domain-containing protein n=1 Tax=Mugilogobius chulae TaxID=88201 RepID=A0AAW0PT07_9GOBI